MKRQRELKVEEELYSAYKDSFAYIERVMNSCETSEQLLNTYRWATEYLFNIGHYERSKRNSKEAFVVLAYLGFKNDIFKEIYARKNEKINKFFVTNDVD